MIWHIFKKDVKLLWPFAGLVVIAYALNTWALARYAHFGLPPELRFFDNRLPLFVHLGVVLVVIAALHQDPIPGDRQDWLVRPIRRRHLLFGKLAFILALMGCLFAIDVATVLMAGLPAADALRNSFTRGVALLCIIGLPAAAIGAVTRDLTEAVILVAVSVATIVTYDVFFAHATQPLLYWLPSTLFFVWAIVAIIGAAAILGLQFAQRRTGPARIVFALALALGTACFYLPYDAAYAILARLNGGQNADSVAVAFNPEGGKTHASPRDRNATGVLGSREITLPLRVMGLSKGAALHMDRAEVTLVRADGSKVDAVSSSGGLTPGFQMRHGLETGEAAQTWHRIYFTPADFARLRSEPVRMEITYWLTVFAPLPAVTFPAIDGDARFVDGVGSCKTKVGDVSVSVGCVTANPKAECVWTFLENPATGQRNPESFYCMSDYAPFPGRVHPMVLGRVEGAAKFLDREGLRKYPVDESQIGQARVQLTGYRPVAHVKRRMVIGEIRLSDWEPQAETPAQ